MTGTDGDSILKSIPDPTAIVEGELRKSSDTRRRILDAAIELLAEQGYHGFSASKVAARARMARPALLYHFPTKLILIQAVVHHTARQRIHEWLQALTSLPPDQSFRGQAFRRRILETSWQLPETAGFRAYAELVLAARTDPELAEALRPAVGAGEQARTAMAEAIFPVGSFDRDDFQLARDVVRFITEGLALQGAMLGDIGNRRDRLAHFLYILVATTEGDSFLKGVVADWARTHPPVSATG